MTIKKKLLLFFILLLVSSKIMGQEKAEFYIQKAIIYKQANEQKNYQLTSYNKVIVTANPEKSSGYIDTIYTKKRKALKIKEIDSSDYHFKRLITKQHLYQTEKISVFTDKDNSLKEEIISTKMAGFKEPIYEYFSLTLQPFSLYKNKLILVEKEYINPLSIIGTRFYEYKILGEKFINNRKLKIIHFNPKNKTRSDKLEGVLFIDELKFSIAKAELRIQGKLNIISKHEFEFNEKLNNWFPKGSSLIIKKGNNKQPIKILGETITFEGTDSKFNPFGKKYASDYLEILSENKYSQCSFTSIPEIEKKYFPIEIKEKAITRKEDLWYRFFNDSIDVRSNPTYVSLDSLIESRKIENKIRIGRKVIKGYYPVGFFDFDLRYLARYNNYEGFRLGFGGITNEKISKIFKTEGYFVYGTKDGEFKGSLNTSFRINKLTETWVGFGYKDDLSEVASTSFEIDKKTFKIYDPRPFNLSTFYNHETWRGFIETKIIPKTELLIQFTQSFTEPKFGYKFNVNNNPQTDFRSSLLTFSIQWNPLSQYMQTPNGRIEFDKNYPKFTFQFSKSIPDLFKNTYDFGKLDFRFDYQKKINSNHKTGFLLETGTTFGDTPLTHLYNHSPNNLNKDKILQRITFAGQDSFETMYFNEFFSDKYLYLHLRHQFPKWQISRQLKPILSLVSRYGIGELNNKQRHQDFEFKTLEQGFYESGFELNQIFKGIGFTTFYRYGPNQLSSFEDNIAIKLSVQINLGFNN